MTLVQLPCKVSKIRALWPHSVGTPRQLHTTRAGLPGVGTVWTCKQEEPKAAIAFFCADWHFNILHGFASLGSTPQPEHHTCGVLPLPGAPAPSFLAPPGRLRLALAGTWHHADVGHGVGHGDSQCFLTANDKEQMQNELAELSGEELSLHQLQVWHWACSPGLSI